MKFEELLEKYQLLLTENNNLKNEIKSLKVQLGIMEQQDLPDRVSEHGTTAFGKTIVAIKLIAERKVNTLILVDRVSLVSQWKERLTSFLTIGFVERCWSKYSFYIKHTPKMYRKRKTETYFFISVLTKILTSVKIGNNDIMRQRLGTVFITKYGIRISNAFIMDTTKDSKGGGNHVR
ncbi:MAG: DEAD/DEAH box helicase family protein [Syntrophomonas sp.]|nr:DEAD/DEAH box helicase family protein [Syntrophomonas sp.]